MIKRFVGKISDESSLDGLINLIAKMTGVDPSEIQLSDETLEKFKSIGDEKLEILKIINPFFDQLRSLNTKDSNKKVYELIDLGKFLWYSKLETDIVILECSEQPDFLIKHQNNIIGIEHTGIYDDEVVAEIKTIKKIIKKCQEKLVVERSDIAGLYNLILIPQNFMTELKLSERRIIDTINDYIIATFDNIVTEKPGFISEVIHTENPRLELTLGEKYWLAELTTEAISKTISKKEAKIDTYKSLKEIKECWLLIVIDGASSDSSFEIKLKRLPTHLTQFDKVFIFDNFKGRIIEGKKIDQ
jgi:hypothetical protein